MTDDLPACSVLFPRDPISCAERQLHSWHPVVPTLSSACGDGASYITSATSENYVQPALCLRAQMARFSSCPFLVLIDDRPGHILSSDSSRRLTSAFGQRSVIRLSSLLARANQSDAAGAITATNQWHAHSMVRLWLWALEGVPRLVLLDADVLLLRNIDELLTHPFNEDLAAVPAIGCSPKRFNGGVLIMKPALSLARALTGRKVCRGLERFERFERASAGCRRGRTACRLMRVRHQLLYLHLHPDQYVCVCFAVPLLPLHAC
jgi:hypothetical protein